MIDTPRGDAPLTLDPAAFQADLDNHAAWLESGHAMLAVADVIWARLEELTAERRQKLDAMLQAVKAGNAPPGTAMLDGMIVFPPEPREDLIALRGCADAYLMNAGYAVENFLKAVRIKRLLGKGKRVEFGGGPDQIPPNHQY